MRSKIAGGIVAAIFILTFIVSCQKDSLKPSKECESVPLMLGPDCQIDFELVCGTNIPHYATMQDFDEIYSCLDVEYDDYNDQYESQYSNLSDDDYDDQVESDGFNEEQTLDDWEVLRNYNSLRTRLNAEEDLWLAGGMIGDDPFIHGLCDIILMTMVNSDGDIKIGAALYHFEADGSAIIVANGACSEFAQAKADPDYLSQYVQRVPSWFNPPETCEHHEYDEGTEYYNAGNKKFIWRVDFDSYIQTSRAKSLIRNFRKKNGNWKRAAVKSYVYVGGRVWNNECVQNSPLSYDDKTKRRKRVGVRTSAFSYANIKSEEIFGTFSIVNENISLNEDINW